MSASQNPLELYELLEMTLENLPIEDVKNARLVSSSWNSMVTTSKKLRRTMFQEPRKVERLLVWTRDGETLDMTPHTTAGIINAPWLNSRADIRPPGALGTFHGIPIAAVLPQLLPNHLADIDCRMIIDLTFSSLDRLLSWPADAMFLQSFLTQPPCTAVHIRCGTALGDETLTIEDPQGLRLAKIRSTLLAIRSEQSFKIRYRPRFSWRDFEVTGVVRGWISEDNFFARLAEGTNEAEETDNFDEEGAGNETQHEDTSDVTDEDTGDVTDEDATE